MPPFGWDISAMAVPKLHASMMANCWFISSYFVKCSLILNRSWALIPISFNSMLSIGVLICLTLKSFMIEWGNAGLRHAAFHESIWLGLAFLCSKLSSFFNNCVRRSIFDTCIIRDRKFPHPFLSDERGSLFGEQNHVVIAINIIVVMAKKPKCCIQICEA